MATGLLDYREEYTEYATLCLDGDPGGGMGRDADGDHPLERDGVTRGRDDDI